MKQITLDVAKASKTIKITTDCEIKGVYVGKGSSELTREFTFVHRKPALKSDIKIKAVLYDQAKLDIRGKLVINKGAKQTDSYLKIDVLLVSPQAKAIAVPSLEIMEDEVKGGHGATVGTIDSEQLLYLTSRGIAKDEAIALIVEGFLK